MRDSVDAALRKKRGVDRVAGADAVRLAGSRADDAGIRRAVHAGEMVSALGRRELREELACRDNGALGRRLRGSRSRFLCLRDRDLSGA